MQDYLEVGQIINTSGLKGLLKVNPFTDEKERFEELNYIYVEKNKTKKEYEIEKVGYIKTFVLLKLKGVDTIEEAEKLKDAYLWIPRTEAKELPEDTYFIVDLLGLEVYTQEGKLLGKVEDVFQTGSNDVYVVKDALGKQILLPAIGEVIKKIDIQNQKITVHLIDGLVG